MGYHRTRLSKRHLSADAARPARSGHHQDPAGNHGTALGVVRVDDCARVRVDPTPEAQPFIAGENGRGDHLPRITGREQASCLRAMLVTGAQGPGLVAMNEIGAQLRRSLMGMYMLTKAGSEISPEAASASKHALPAARVCADYRKWPHNGCTP